MTRIREGDTYIELANQFDMLLTVGRHYDTRNIDIIVRTGKEATFMVVPFLYKFSTDVLLLPVKIDKVCSYVHIVNQVNGDNVFVYIRAGDLINPYTMVTESTNEVEYRNNTIVEVKRTECRDVIERMHNRNRILIRRDARREEDLVSGVCWCCQSQWHACKLQCPLQVDMESMLFEVVSRQYDIINKGYHRLRELFTGQVQIANVTNISRYKFHLHTETDTVYGKLPQLLTYIFKCLVLSLFTTRLPTTISFIDDLRIANTPKFHDNRRKEVLLSPFYAQTGPVQIHILLDRIYGVLYIENNEAIGELAPRESQNTLKETSTYIWCIDDTLFISHAYVGKNKVLIVKT